MDPYRPRKTSSSCPLDVAAPTRFVARRGGAGGSSGGPSNSSGPQRECGVAAALPVHPWMHPLLLDITMKILTHRPTEPLHALHSRMRCERLMLLQGGKRAAGDAARVSSGKSSGRGSSPRAAVESGTNTMDNARWVWEWLAPFGVEALYTMMSPASPPLCGTHVESIRGATSQEKNKGETGEGCSMQEDVHATVISLLSRQVRITPEVRRAYTTSGRSCPVMTPLSYSTCTDVEASVVVVFCLTWIELEMSGVSTMLEERCTLLAALLALRVLESTSTDEEESERSFSKNATAAESPMEGDGAASDAAGSLEMPATSGEKSPSSAEEPMDHEETAQKRVHQGTCSIHQVVAATRSLAPAQITTLLVYLRESLQAALLRGKASPRWSKSPRSSSGSTEPQRQDSGTPSGAEETVQQYITQCLQNLFPATATPATSITFSPMAVSRVLTYLSAIAMSLKDVARPMALLLAARGPTSFSQKFRTAWLAGVLTRLRLSHEEERPCTSLSRKAATYEALGNRLAVLLMEFSARAGGNDALCGIAQKATDALFNDEDCGSEGESKVAAQQKLWNHLLSWIAAMVGGCVDF